MSPPGWLLAPQQTPGAGPPASHPLGTRGQFLQTTHTVTPDRNGRARGQGAPHTQHVKNNHPRGTRGVWGAYNSPGLALLGFLVTGLWLLNLTVVVIFNDSEYQYLHFTCDKIRQQGCEVTFSG